MTSATDKAEAPSQSDRAPNADETASVGDTTSTRQNSGTWNVWRGDLHEAITALATAQEIFPYLFVQTTTLGTVARPAGLFKDAADLSYQRIRWNVDLLEVVQIAISVADENGLQPNISTWQFNFYFSKETGLYEEKELQVLEKTGVDFSLRQNYHFGDS